MSLTAVLREMIGVFDELGLQYAVMGGMAVRVYGIPRPTHDVDFTVAVPNDRRAELFAAVTRRGYEVPQPYLNGWVDRVSEMPVIKLKNYHGQHSTDIDLFLAESEFQRSLLDRRVLSQVDGVTVSLVSAEDLILLKLLAGRPRDLADIGDVIFTQGQLDDSYLRHWASELGVVDALQRVFDERESH